MNIVQMVENYEMSVEEYNEAEKRALERIRCDD